MMVFTFSAPPATSSAVRSRGRGHPELQGRPLRFTAHRGRLPAHVISAPDMTVAPPVDRALIPAPCFDASWFGAPNDNPDPLLQGPHQLRARRGRRDRDPQREVARSTTVRTASTRRSSSGRSSGSGRPLQVGLVRGARAAINSHRGDGLHDRPATLAGRRSRRSLASSGRSASACSTYDRVPARQRRSATEIRAREEATPCNGGGGRPDGGVCPAADSGNPQTPPQRNRADVDRSGDRKARERSGRAHPHRSRRKDAPTRRARGNREVDPRREPQSGQGLRPHGLERLHGHVASRSR